MSTNKNIEMNGQDRNAFVFGLSPQAEIWNGRLAMLVATYVLLRDVLNLF
ncbi:MULTISPECIES: hypothetical protein [Gloeobacter]|uniref:CAB/ELIP/HLIP superfamily protein n=2 Tax=Gloeobacter TaxID=33071 RepID=Q7NGB1_GLOVI|nr:MULTISPECIES: hypothetical protein [Gloeobacter]UFP94141.1 hypothetical protein ISF26_20635 [Gloeobacter morelensis MG652769]BAC91202.1 CAB/ELIP/HLIP superfamily protein [Gloeobacter violaceus PCC 7421]